MVTLIRLAYVSRGNGLSDTDITTIQDAANRKNRRLGLGGFLIAVNGCFFQVLEGPESAVRAVMARIHRDTRHRDVRVVYDRPVETRAFARWGMVNLTNTPRLLVNLLGRDDPGGAGTLPGGGCALHMTLLDTPAFAEKMIAAGALIHDMTSTRGEEITSDRQGLAVLPGGGASGGGASGGGTSGGGTSGGRAAARSPDAGAAGGEDPTPPPWPDAWVAQ